LYPNTNRNFGAAWEEMAREDEEKFHIELLKYARGEPNDIGPGTVGMLEAEIAKRLVEKDSSLLLPINRDQLRIEIQLIYDREHTVTVTLSPRDIASVRAYRQ
jgi:hypothetical protein